MKIFRGRIAIGLVFRVGLMPEGGAGRIHGNRYALCFKLPPQSHKRPEETMDC